MRREEGVRWRFPEYMHERSVRRGGGSVIPSICICERLHNTEGKQGCDER